MSVGLHVGIFDHATPDLGLLFDKSRGFRGRAAGGTQIDLGEMVLCLGALKDLVHRLVELCDHRGGGFWWRRECVPGSGFETLNSSFVERWNIGQAGYAFVGGDGEDARLVRLVEFDG